MSPVLIVSAIIVFFLLVVLVKAIRIVPEYQRIVVFRLGRLLGTKGPGLVLLIPFVDKGTIVDLREFFLEIPRQDSITKDNAAIAIDFIMYYKVLDPAMSVVQVSNFAGAATNIAATTLRAVIGDISLDDVLAKLRRGLEWADVIVASGGVSVGAHDVVKDAFAQIGRIDLWRIAVQPGRPLAFGRAPAADGQREVLLFGLPGNPVSSLVTFELFVRPVLRRLAGHEDVIGRDIVRATLDAPVTKAPKRRTFLRVALTQTATGTGWQASLAGGQDSHVLSALAAADGLAIIGEEFDAVPAGTEVKVIRIR